MRLSEILGRSAPAFDELVERTDAWRAHRLGEASSMRQHVRALRLRSYVAVGAVGGLLLATVGLLGFAGRRFIYSPIVDLTQAIARYRRGELPAGAPVSGPRELAELGRAFNEMTAALAHQRELQIAALAGIAHDLRNPLAALKLGADTAAAELEGTSGRAASGIAIIQRQIDRLARMTNDLLDSTRIEAGVLELEPRLYDLRESVRASTELLAPTAAGHTLVVSLPAAPICIEADAARVEQVVNNLLSNAIKYSPAGSRIEVALEQWGDEALIRVSDEGVGMSSDEVSRIFTPFVRLEGKGGVKGTGLGLSVVRRIVLAHGGRIEVQSTPGQGSAFSVWLPMASAPRQNAEGPPSLTVH